MWLAVGAVPCACPICENGQPRGIASTSLPNLNSHFKNFQEKKTNLLIVYGSINNKHSDNSNSDPLFHFRRGSAGNPAPDK